MKIILLYPKWTGQYGLLSYFVNKSASYPPLCLAYLAAIAENKGHEVKIIDGQIENLSLEKMVKETISFNPDIIGLGGSSPFFHINVNLGKKIKEKISVPIVVGGPHITIMKEQAFEKCFDYAFIGNSDNSWPLFLERYEKGNIISDIKGIMYKDGGEIKFTGESDTDVNNDLNSLPIPARHLLKTNLYRIGTLRGTKNFTTIMTIQGCPYNCIFCKIKTLKNTVRLRSPKLVIEEIKLVVERFGIRHFIFLDQTLTLDKNHILEICDLIAQEHLNITFEGGTRAELVDEEVISKMAKAGLIRLSFGLESVDETMRETMKKEVPFDCYRIANQLTNKYGIETINSCIIGLPGETVDTVRKTLAYLRKTPEIKQANISIAVPYPGTELHEMAKNNEKNFKLLTDDFSKFRRYNSAVISVGSLSPEDINDLQNEAYISIYLAPWRWLPMIKKSGFLGALLTFSRLLKLILKGKTRFITNKQLDDKNL